ncbi:DUF6737 family protein [Fischerella thermalis]|jgi:hypothetical protein|uniref:DUF6737 domain-containing protein n=1 Tax=Fischerella thermalis JSC-11 TaxID=741277 RepID=G6FYA7_9CYAN|nr:DUF6737 family protein [Fischerella thermalis]EHC09684.1 hypothetical protein FJSC11DRAFT_3856 [Fischerella thermalis JSC-11]PLZ10213.1 hypothetical protein CBP19_14900 [Fischerella thermalis WC1110]PLZ10539.1 hypothetical protein CBP17_10885 [Fischerella thermalis WC114]PLZ19300.1 hypothetical protein CBP30_13145 [Fischerella thermalis WC157]PLZ22706.1 hypothetical protein CBP29_13405 [Fischerella thermalis WC341]
MSERKSISPWKFKPWWCQPWSILLTGTMLISASWVIFKTVWLTVLIAIPVLTWMGFFLLIWPQLIIRSGILESYQLSKDKIPDQNS